MRRVSITTEYGVFEYIYNGKEVKDSEALHYLLCENDPGDNYTVQFQNHIYVWSMCNCENEACNHTLNGEMCMNKTPGTSITMLGNVCPTCAINYNA
jgi:hypothetical protein